jgi:hypothetical protein
MYLIHSSDNSTLRRALMQRPPLQSENDAPRPLALNVGDLVPHVIESPKDSVLSRSPHQQDNVGRAGTLGCLPCYLLGNNYDFGTGPSAN